MRRRAASGRDNFFNSGARNRVINIHNANSRAFAGESESDRAADAAACPGNYRYFSIKTKTRGGILRIFYDDAPR
jgi:hypothetical protein